MRNRTFLAIALCCALAVMAASAKKPAKPSDAQQHQSKLFQKKL